MPRKRFPSWIRVKVNRGDERRRVARLIDDLELHTVCQGARCPNLPECWHRRSATFMILGNTCTRDCAFCAVGSGQASPPQPGEPARVAEAVVRMELEFVVLTSVTRDDLPDGGAGHFAATIRAIRGRRPGTGIEILTPDFGGSEDALRTVLAAEPTVLNHNLETCRRLTPRIRSGAAYDRSLDVLRRASQVGGQRVLTKSGLMVGLGESSDEVAEMLSDLRAVDVDIVTIGQYLPPTESHWPLARYVTPDEFSAWAERAADMGFKGVASAPLVRSSYRAGELAVGALQNMTPGEGEQNECLAASD